MNSNPISVHAAWDDDAKVWTASTDEVPGLATEADTLLALEQKLMVVIPELLEANGVDCGTRSIPVRIKITIS
jgi:hypothetical protein